jgi:hypothetical protein
MNNLVKRTPINLPLQISSLSRSVYSAHNCDMIKKISDMNIVVKSIHQSINRSLADKGISMELEDMDYLKKNVTEDVLKDFPTLTLQDVQLCFSLGVRGNLGEYYGMNVVTFYNWLKKYKEEIIPETMGEVKKHLPPVQIEEEKVDYKKLDLEKVDTICSIINSFNEDGIYYFNDFGNIHFKFLNKFSVFDEFSEEEILSLKEDAKQELITETKQKNLILLAQRKNFQLNNINKLLDDIEYGSKDTESTINIIFLKLLLKRFIVRFKSLGKDIEKFKIDLTKKVENGYDK